LTDAGICGTTDRIRKLPILYCQPSFFIAFGANRQSGKQTPETPDGRVLGSRRQNVNLGWLFHLGTACISAGVSYLCRHSERGLWNHSPKELRRGKALLEAEGVLDAPHSFFGSRSGKTGNVSNLRRNCRIFQK
jgi:hypothetical protein